MQKKQDINHNNIWEFIYKASEKWAFDPQEEFESYPLQLRPKMGTLALLKEEESQ